MSPRLRRAAPLAAGVAALALAGAVTPAVAGDHHVHRGIHYSSWDAQWLQTSIMGDRFEITGGQLAVTKGVTPLVRGLGARLVQDHTKSLRSSIALARRLGIDVPTAPSPSQRWELQTVGAMSGTAFDVSYGDLEILDHVQDIREGKDEVSDGSNRSVRHEASSELPTLRTHLQLSRAARAAVSG